MNKLTCLLLITVLFMAGCQEEGGTRSASDVQADSAPTLPASPTATTEPTATTTPEPTSQPFTPGPTESATAEPTETPPLPTLEPTATLSPEEIAPELLPVSETELAALYPTSITQPGTGNTIHFENGINPESQLPKLKEYVTETGETYALYTHPDHPTTVLYAINKETGERHLAYYTDGTHGIEFLILLDQELEADVTLSDLQVPNANQVIGELVMNLLYINHGTINGDVPDTTSSFSQRVNWMNSLKNQLASDFDSGGMEVNLRPLNLGNQLITPCTRFVIKLERATSDANLVSSLMQSGATSLVDVDTVANGSEISTTI